MKEQKNNISVPKKSIAQRMEDAKNNTAKETKYSKKIYTRTSGTER